MTISRTSSFAQSVLNPADTIVEYDSTNPPVQPPYGQIGKWVRTKSVSWNSDSYKCYIYQGSCFRLKFPKSYNPTANDGKKYPLAIVFHGGGEAGPITDNETSLYHGGQPYLNAADGDQFDGYIMFMQSQGYWGTTSYLRIIDIINYMVANNKMDPFRITVNGLSSGGQASWDMVNTYTNYVSASLPMSNVSIGYKDPSVVNKVKFTPMWNFQGSLDGSPAPSTAQQVDNAMVAAGGDYKYSEYANVGHNTWDSAFADPDFFPFLVRSYCSNPWVLYGRTGFCSASGLNLTVGVPPGFDGYQWRKNGTVISGATSNTINVTDLGTYDAKVLRGSTWSDWSHTPVVIQITPPTVTPPIRVSGLMSNVIVSGDGKNFVNLEVPDSGYTSYKWKKVGSDSIISTQRIYKATQPGQYIAAVTEQFGCSSVYSQPFTVVNAAGANAPDAASKLTATTLSTTGILLSWENNPHPIYNETAFEIYRSAGQDGNYSYVGKIPADTLSYKDLKLSAGVTYYYKIRAVNNNGAAPLSNSIIANTLSDKTLPTPPGTLKVVYATNSSIKLQWKPSTDDVGIENYQVYINGTKTYTTTDTTIIANALQQGKVYTFYVKAFDSSGNYSVQSNVVSSPAILNGLVYKYYEGYFLTVPNFNTLKPVSIGVSSNTDLSVSFRQAQIGFLWEGFLNVPADGTYRIGTISDDGSKLWLNAYDPNLTPLVNNDHEGSSKSKYTSITLKKGFYPISIAYFQNKNVRGIKLSWSNPAFFGDSLAHDIEDKYLTSDYTAADTAPALPNNLAIAATATDKINITWADKSNNETGFEVYRSFKPVLDYNIIYTSAANVTQYQDTGLLANTLYYYKIKAINNFGTSAYTTNVSTKTLKATNPKPPTGLTAVALSSSSIKISWNDVDSSEINYQVFRSASDSFNFKPAALLPANSTTFTDTLLYGNTDYYYKVKTINAVTISVDKPAVKAKTLNNPPVITNKFNQKSVTQGIQTTVDFTATDPDGDTLSFGALNLPAFASLVSAGFNKASLILNPATSDRGNYPNIKIYTTDKKGGSDTTTFSLTVDNNRYPVINTIPDYTLTEGDVTSIVLTATDKNSTDSITWIVTGLPSSYSIKPITSRKANLTLKPDYAAAGTYAVQVTANDGNGGISSTQFNLTVNDKDPNLTVDVRFKEQDSMGFPWNDVTSVNTSNFKDILNRPTTIGLQMQTTWFSTWHEGPQTGNNSGIYPDPVLKDYYYFGSNGGPATVTSKITGLDTSKLYALSFYAGSNFAGAANNGTTIFAIGAQSIPLAVQNNTTKTADFNNIKPAADGTVTFTMSKGANTPSGYINAIVIKSIYTDGSKPLTPTFLVATNAAKGVQLTWNDNAYNEIGYNVYRSTNASGPFTLINGTLPGNTTSYVDTSAAGITQYYYIVKATNQTGISDSSNVATVLTTDKVPVITPISSIIIKNNQQQTINVTAKDDATDHVTLTPSNLPSFVTFTDNGNGSGFFSVNPTSGIIGTFEDVTVKATDNSDSSSVASFNITVTDQTVTSVYVNFSNGSLAASPWNNFTSFPSTNATLSNLLDDNGSTTTVAVKILNAFQNNFAGGMQPGNNKGVYPEIVMRTGILEGSTKTDSIQLSGLTKSKKYNFVFFNSHDDGLKGNTNFTVNNQTVSLNATHNINTTAEINGIVPDANGQVTIKVAKASGADFAYLNSLIIQSYDSTQTLLAPSDLRVVSTTRNTVGLQWADRSFDESGFEIWRASDTTNPSYTLLATVAANATKFVDTGLSAAHTYYYTIRSINGSVKSAFCNPVAATTYAQAIYINFTYTSNANVPWNNTDALPEPGVTWRNFVDNTGIPSSIGMQELGLFAGIYGPGMNTGNNSGIYPDKVLADCYGLFPGESTTMKATGLNLNMKYDLTFFASANITGDVNTSYIVNGKKVILNAALNTDGIVTMYNVAPNENGEIILTISPNSTSSQFGLIGALVVQEYTQSTKSIPAAPQLNKGIVALKNNNTQTLKQAATADNSHRFAVYPNPFHHDFSVSLFSEKEDNVNIELYSVNGKLVTRKNLGVIPKGQYNFRMVPDQSITPGIYLLKINYINSGLSEYIKILKQ